MFSFLTEGLHIYIHFTCFEIVFELYGRNRLFSNQVKLGSNKNQTNCRGLSNIKTYISPKETSKHICNTIHDIFETHYYT